MIPSHKLEHFILAFGLEISADDFGRPTSLTQLCNSAKGKLGDVEIREMQDALFNINPMHASLIKFAPNGRPVSFDRNRSRRNWRDFFNGDFNILVLPGGRIRMGQLEGFKEHSLTQDSGLSKDDIRFARIAVDEARKSNSEEDGRCHPKVGAVVVKDGAILAAAHRGEPPHLANHAEYIALEKKLPDVTLVGGTVYTTLEPCTTRNAPKVPCAERLIARRIRRVVIGMLDPDPRITGRGILLLRSADIAVDLFPRELMSELEELNRDFTRDRQTSFVRTEEKRPTPDAWLALFKEKQNLEEEVASLEAQLPAFFARPVVKAGKDSIDLLGEKIERKKRQLGEITKRIALLD